MGMGMGDIAGYTHWLQQSETARGIAATRATSAPKRTVAKLEACMAKVGCQSIIDSFGSCDT